MHETARWGIYYTTYLELVCARECSTQSCPPLVPDTITQLVDRNHTMVDHDAHSTVRDLLSGHPRYSSRTKSFPVHPLALQDDCGPLFGNIGPISCLDLAHFARTKEPKALFGLPNYKTVAVSTNEPAARCAPTSAASLHGHLVCPHSWDQVDCRKFVRNRDPEPELSRYDDAASTTRGHELCCRAGARGRYSLVQPKPLYLAVADHVRGFALSGGVPQIPSGPVG